MSYYTRSGSFPGPKTTVWLQKVERGRYEVHAADKCYIAVVYREGAYWRIEDRFLMTHLFGLDDRGIFTSRWKAVDEVIRRRMSGCPVTNAEADALSALDTGKEG